MNDQQADKLAFVIVDALLDGPLSDPSIVARLPGAKPLVDVVRAACHWQADVYASRDEVRANLDALLAALDRLPSAVRDLIEGDET